MIQTQHFTGCSIYYITLHTKCSKNQPYLKGRCILFPWYMRKHWNAENKGVRLLLRELGHRKIHWHSLSSWINTVNRKEVEQTLMLHFIAHYIAFFCKPRHTASRQCGSKQISKAYRNRSLEWHICSFRLLFVPSKAYDRLNSKIIGKEKL